MGQKLWTGLTGLGVSLEVVVKVFARAALNLNVWQVLEDLLPRWFPFMDGELALVVGRTPQFLATWASSCQLLCVLQHSRWLHQKRIIQESKTKPFMTQLLKSCAILPAVP